MVSLIEILGYLPHRYPMLLVDRIIDVNEDMTRCKGLKNVTINEPFFQGHYPEMPVMPGVLILEAMAQCGAATILMNPEHKGLIPIIGAIDNAKFKRMVVPGDQLIFDIEILWMRGKIGKMRSTASVEGDLAAQMEMTFKLMERNG